jgi:hypothetical protein
LTKHYRSKDGSAIFQFTFAPEAGGIGVWCLSHPSLDGCDTDPHKTHIFPSGRLCFAEGHAPRTQRRAEELAQQWGEYILEYRRTGRAQ